MFPIFPLISAGVGLVTKVAASSAIHAAAGVATKAAVSGALKAATVTATKAAASTALKAATTTAIKAAAVNAARTAGSAATQKLIEDAVMSYGIYQLGKQAGRSEREQEEAIQEQVEGMSYAERQEALAQITAKIAELERLLRFYTSEYDCHHMSYGEYQQVTTELRQQIHNLEQLKAAL